jgi:hypothetical protein
LDSVKPVVDQTTILALLQENSDLPIRELTPVEGGQIVQIVSFRISEQAYILRFNPGSFEISFQKEAFSYTTSPRSRCPCRPSCRWAGSGISDKTEVVSDPRPK